MPWHTAAAAVAAAAAAATGGASTYCNYFSWLAHFAQLALSASAAAAVTAAVQTETFLFLFFPATQRLSHEVLHTHTHTLERVRKRDVEGDKSAASHPRFMLRANAKFLLRSRVELCSTCIKK